MLPIVLASFLFVLLLTVISVYGYRVYVRPSQIYDRVGGVADIGAVQDGPGLRPRDVVVRVIEQIGEQIPLGVADQTVTRRDLTMAGFRSDGAVQIFYGLKVVFALVVLAFAFLAHTHVTANPVLRVVFLVAGAGLGFYLPSMYLDKLVSKRHQVLRTSLPDALDMIVIAVEAGLGLDQALQYVGREIAHSHKDLSEELGMVGLEMRAGKRRSEALRNLADRTGEPELRKLVAILIQTDRFGTSMGESLRTHSDFMRMRRKQEAEEKGAKVGVKLVFPIFIFILPSMMLVAAGPAILKLFRDLFPMMDGFGK